MSNMTAIVPATVDLSELQYRSIGELLIDSATGTVYMVVSKLNEDISTSENKVYEKQVVPIKGDAYYKFVQNLKYNNLIQPNVPLKKHAQTWYNTAIGVAYSDKDPIQSAYITVKKEVPKTVDNEQGYEWVRILPMTEAANVILGTIDKKSGRPITLADLVHGETGELALKPAYVDNQRLLNPTPTKGELYIEKIDKGEFLAKFNINGDKNNSVVLGNTSEDVMNTVNAIHKISRTLEDDNRPPVNFTPNTAWYSYSNLTPTGQAFSDAKLLYMNTVDNARYSTYGLQFKHSKVAQDNNSYVRIIEGGKGVVLVPSAQTHQSFVVTNLSPEEFGDDVDQELGFTKGKTSYFELFVDKDISDDENSESNINHLQFVFTDNSYLQNNNPSYGKLFDISNRNILAISPSNYRHGDREVEITDISFKRQGFNNKTLFFIVHKSDTNSDNAYIGFGYINENRERVFIAGKEESEEYTFEESTAEANGWLYVRNCTTFGIVNTYNDLNRIYERPITEDILRRHALRRVYINKVVGKNLDPYKWNILNDAVTGSQKMFQPTVLASNAKSVFLDDNTTLNDLVVGGRLITTLREFENTPTGRQNLQNKQGELLISAEYNNEENLNTYKLIYSDMNGNLVPIINEHEQVMLNHLKRSVQYHSLDKNKIRTYVDDLDVDPKDPSIVHYIGTEFMNNTLKREGDITPDNYIVANASITVKETDGTLRYRYTIPNTLSDVVWTNSELWYNSPTNYESLKSYLYRLQTQVNSLEKNTATHFTLNVPNYGMDSKLIENDGDGALNAAIDNAEHITDVVSFLSSVLNENKSFTTFVDDNPNNKYSNLFKGFKKYENGARLYGLYTVTKGDGHRTAIADARPNHRNTEARTAPIYFTVRENNTDKIYQAISVFRDGAYTKPEFKEVTLEYIDQTTGKKTITTNNIILSNSITAKLGDIRNINTNGLTLNTDPKNNRTSGIKVNDQLISVTPKNLLKVEGAKDTPNLPAMVMGDGDTFNELKIYSTNQPKWIDNSNVAHNMLVDDDLTGFYSYKKRLNDGTVNPVDLNTLNTKDKSGYYTYVHTRGVGDLTRKNFPSDADLTGTFVLEVFSTSSVEGNYGQENVLTQVLHHYIYEDPYINGTNNAHTYTRTLGPNGFTNWIKSTSSKELDLKFDRRGGMITGDVVMTSHNITGVNNLSTDTIALYSGIVSKDYNEPIITPLTTSNVFSNNNLDTIIQGKDVFIETRVNPDNPTPTERNKVATEKDIKGLKDKLKNDYATKDELDKLKKSVPNADEINNKFNNVVIKDATTRDKANANVIEGKMHVGGNVNAISFNGGHTDNDTDIYVQYGSSAKIKYHGINNPNKNGNDIDTNPNLISEYLETTKFDLYGDASVLSIGSQKPNTGSVGSGVPTVIQFRSDKNPNDNSSAYYLRNIYGNTTRGNWSKVITSGDLVTLTNLKENRGISEDKGISSAAAKDIYDNTIGKNLEVPTTLTNPTKADIKDLPAGTYSITRSNNFGLDFTKGIMTVYPTINGEKVAVAYNLVDSNNKNEAKLAYINMTNLNNATQEWKYIYTNENSYSKEEMDDKLQEVNHKIDKFVKSLDYTANGESANNISANKLIFSNMVDEQNRNKFMQFSTSRMKFTSGRYNIIITLKGATGVGVPINDTISINIPDITKPQIFKSTTASTTPGATSIIKDVKITSDKSIQFKFKPTSNGNNNFGSAFNVFIQVFGLNAAIEENDIHLNSEKGEGASFNYVD